MSIEASTRVQKRDKPTAGGGGKQNQSHKVPQATAEQIRLAQIVSDASDDEIQMRKNVAKVIEITGTSEEGALVALYDSCNDPTRAVELILEGGKDEGWEKAGRKKNRGGTSTNRGADTTEKDSKEDKNDSTWEREETRGRGRGSKRGKSRNFDRNRSNDDNDKENENTDNRSKGRRGGGRGRGRSLTSRGRGGRQSNRGAPRHFRNAGSGRQSEGFDSPTEPVDTWKGPDAECWDIEVGTWSSEDAKKQQSRKSKMDSEASYSETWGTESWNDDLSESRVFQAQNVSMPVQPVTGNMPDRVPSQNAVDTTSNHLTNTTPQMGDRIDLGTLFKKSGSSNLQGPTTNDIIPSYGNSANMGYGSSGSNQTVQSHVAPDVIQQLQQQSQSNSLFSENKQSGPPATSRLFSGYERSQQQSQSGSQGLFDSKQQQQSSIDSPFAQFNGKLTHSQQPNSSPSSFLDSFSGLKSQSMQQGGMLGQLTDLSSKQSALSSYSQVRQHSNQSSGNPTLNNFSQGQQQQATDAVKASLGLPVGEVTTLNSMSSRQVPPGLVPSQQNSSLGRLSPLNAQTIAQDTKTEPHLSFGSPLPPQLNQQNKQQRRKMPPLNSKIPASAVEMPGSTAYNSKEYASFSLQFGADDSTSPLDSTLQASSYGVAIPQNGQSGVISQHNSLFMNNDVANANSVNGHISTGAPDSSLFSQKMSSDSVSRSGQNELNNAENTRLSSQRLSESVIASSIPDQTSRIPPPGLSMPTSSSRPNLGNSTHMGTSRLGSDLGSSFQSSTEHIGGSHSLESSLDPSSSLSSSFSQVHSFYSSSSSLGVQKQSQQMQSELSGSAGRSLRSPVPSSSLPGSLQSSPMPQNKMMHSSSNTPTKDKTTGGMGAVSSLDSNMSSLATSLSQVNITSSSLQHISHGHHHHGGSTLASQGGGTGGGGSGGSSILNPVSILPALSSSSASPYSSSLSASGNRGKQDTTSASSNISGSGYGSTQQDSMSSFSSSYPSTTSSSPYNAVSSVSYSQSSQQSSVSTPAATVGMGGSNLSVASTNSLGGFASKTSHLASNKLPPNVTPSVTAPILQNQYGIPMAGLMPYTPDMYGYDQLLLQSRVINHLNYYDMSHYHGNTQSAAINNRDSSSGMGQTSAGQGKFNRGEPTSPTPNVSQLSLAGSMGSALSQHNVPAGQQNPQLKGSQTGGHHSAQQQYVGAMPAYAGYGSLPYYGLGMPSTAGFQYPPTMFAAAAMHQAPKHSVNTTAGFQQPNAGFSHSYSNASITSSASGLPDLQGSNFSKTHTSAFDKQQGFHQHANTPPPFNIQALTAAVAAGSGAGTGGGAPGLSPYAAAPYMTMLQPHQASQQQAIHLLQQQHQDASGGQSGASQRGLGSNSMAKSANKPSSYGSATSAYWGN